MISDYSKKIEEELAILSPLLTSLGWTMEKQQPHISGERAVLSQEKFVLLCQEQSTGKRIVVKCSKTPSGIEEIGREKAMRDHTAQARYATDTLALPQEIYFGEKNGYVILATEYVPQNKIFVSHSPEEQFFMALRALERQEAFHATTYEHLASARQAALVMTPESYARRIDAFLKNIGEKYDHPEAAALLKKASDFFNQNRDLVRSYSYYLVHEDLVPHNFRVNNDRIYVLDCGSLQYGNKYESWARFLNYMVIHNPELERQLKQHVAQERGPREYMCLRALRVFKIMQLMNYYAALLDKVSGNFLELTKVRLAFWSQALSAMLSDTNIAPQERADYIRRRDSLRSEEEKARQREFASA